MVMAMAKACSGEMRPFMSTLNRFLRSLPTCNVGERGYLPGAKVSKIRTFRDETSACTKVHVAIARHITSAELTRLCSAGRPLLPVAD
eukprot:6178013-Pleurochrysis_carterae.AAC.1